MKWVLLIWYSNLMLILAFFYLSWEFSCRSFIWIPHPPLTKSSYVFIFVGKTIHIYYPSTFKHNLMANCIFILAVVGTPMIPVHMGIMTPTPTVMVSSLPVLSKPAVPRKDTVAVRAKDNDDSSGPTTTVFVGNISEKASDMLIRQLLAVNIIFSTSLSLGRMCFQDHVFWYRVDSHISFLIIWIFLAI